MWSKGIQLQERDELSLEKNHKQAKAYSRSRRNVEKKGRECTGIEHWKAFSKHITQTTKKYFFCKEKDKAIYVEQSEG